MDSIFQRRPPNRTAPGIGKVAETYETKQKIASTLGLLNKIDVVKDVCFVTSVGFGLAAVAMCCKAGAFDASTGMVTMQLDAALDQAADHLYVATKMFTGFIAAGGAHQIVMGHLRQISGSTSQYIKQKPRYRALAMAGLATALVIQNATIPVALLNAFAFSAVGITLKRRLNERDRPDRKRLP
ncbi:MAG: hypothetical protein PHE27_05665 [Alphaproteobacteria bacterium]|nr:hypothetical protein [Alphaproteobacteria bacterium]